ILFGWQTFKIINSKEEKQMHSKTVMINTYNGAFEVDRDWLIQQISQPLDNFLSTYTWDDGAWLKLNYNAYQANEEIKQLTTLLKQGYSLFKNGNQEGVLHISSKGNGYQFSYFDQYGAIGDVQKSSLAEMARS